MTTTVTAHFDDEKSFVDVLVTSPPSGSVTVTVTRTAKGRTFTVRGLVGVSVLDGATIRDYEAPFGVESSYRPQFFDADGLPVGYGTPATVTLPKLATSHATFHDPLDPATSVLVILTNGAASSVVRPTDADRINIPRRSVGLTLPGTRGGVTGVVLDCYTDTRAVGERFDALFGGYDSDALSIVCVRTNPETWLPPTLFAFVGSPGLHPLGYVGEEVQWKLTGDETTPPTPAVIVPTLTYQAFTDYYMADGYTGFTAAYATYLEASRDYSVITS